MSAAIASPEGSLTAPRLGRGESFRDMPSASRTWPVVVAVALAAVVWLALLTPTGVLHDAPDSVAYVGVARNITAGRGITMPFVPQATDDRPLTEARYDGRAPLYQYSPGLPVLLAGLLAVGLSVTAAVTTVNLVSTAVIVALTSWMTLRFTRGSYTAAVIVPFLFMTTMYPGTAGYATSEPVFMACVLGALALLARHLRYREVWPLVGFAVLASAAALTRFVGVSIIGTGVLAVALWSDGSLRRRVVRAVIVGGGALAPLLLWMSHDALSASGGAGSLAFHPPKHFFGRLTQRVSSFIDGEKVIRPQPLKYLVVFLAGCLVVAGVVRALRSRRGSGGPAPFDGQLVRVVATFLVLYPIALFTSMTFFHGAPFAARYLLPIVPIAFAFAAAALTPVRATGWRQLAAVALVALITVAVVVRHGYAGADTWKIRALRDVNPVRSGSVFTSLETLPRRDIVFTNVPDTVYEWTRRFAISLPVERSIWTEEAIPEHAEDVRDVGRALCAEPGVVLVYGLRQAAVAQQAASWAERSHLVVDRVYPDGVVLRPAPGSCT